MKFSTRILAAGAVAAGLVLPASQALAAWDARTTANVNIRVGPGTGYGFLDVVPAGNIVTVYNCISAYSWCDVEWDGYRGWVYGSYLTAPGYGVLPTYGARIGVPVVTFSFNTYHDRWYRDRPWYRERAWTGRWHRDRRHVRDRRHERRDALQRTQRRDQAQERRRDVRQERRANQRQQVRQQQRTNQRRDARQERRIQQQMNPRQQQRALRRDQRQPRAQQRQQRQQANPRQQRRVEQRQQRRGQ